jgi:hypothetical protein
MNEPNVDWQEIPIKDMIQKRLPGVDISFENCAAPLLSQQFRATLSIVPPFSGPLDLTMFGYMSQILGMLTAKVQGHFLYADRLSFYIPREWKWCTKAQLVQPPLRMFFDTVNGLSFLLCMATNVSEPVDVLWNRRGRIE